MTAQKKKYLETSKFQTDFFLKHIGFLVECTNHRIHLIYNNIRVKDRIKGRDLQYEALSHRKIINTHT